MNIECGMTHKRCIMWISIYKRIGVFDSVAVMAAYSVAVMASTDTTAALLLYMLLLAAGCSSHHSPLTIPSHTSATTPHQ